MSQKPVIMVSACLLGEACRYDGSAKPFPGLTAGLSDFELASFCPEKLGNLPIPRPPAEIQNGDGAAVLAGKAKVVDRSGSDCTAAFVTGAQKTLEMAQKIQPVLVVGKTKSPSCGVGRVYDGSFSGTLLNGDGVTTALLREAGLAVCDEEGLAKEMGIVIP
jgi:uncharacterized protein YbbK (DUF523 family)